MTDEIKKALESDPPSIEDIAKKVVEGSGLQIDPKLLAERAKKMISGEGTDPKNIESIQKARRLYLAIGSSVPRVLISEMIRLGTAPEEKKTELLKHLDSSVLENPEVGCITVGVANDVGKQSAYILLDICEEHHDPGEQIKLLLDRVPENKHEEIMRHISSIVEMGRLMYVEVLLRNEMFMREVMKYAPLPPNFNPFLLYIDKSNTTLCLPVKNMKRVGVYVRFGDVVEKNSGDS